MLNIKKVIAIVKNNNIKGVRMESGGVIINCAEREKNFNAPIYESGGGFNKYGYHLNPHKFYCVDLVGIRTIDDSEISRIKNILGMN